MANHSIAGIAHVIEGYLFVGSVGSNYSRLRNWAISSGYILGEVCGISAHIYNNEMSRWLNEAFRERSQFRISNKNDWGYQIIPLLAPISWDVPNCFNLQSQFVSCQRRGVNAC